MTRVGIHYPPLSARAERILGFVRANPGCLAKEVAAFEGIAEHLAIATLIGLEGRGLIGEQQSLPPETRYRIHYYPEHEHP